VGGGGGVAAAVFAVVVAVAAGVTVVVGVTAPPVEAAWPLETAPFAGGKPPAGVERIESLPFTTPSCPKSVPLVPKPAYELGKAVKLGVWGAGGGAGAGELGAAGATPVGAVVVIGPLSGAMPDIPLSYPERALH
jgi:hypothetical protein